MDFLPDSEILFLNTIQLLSTLIRLSHLTADRLFPFIARNFNRIRCTICIFFVPFRVELGSYQQRILLVLQVEQRSFSFSRLADCKTSFIQDQPARSQGGHRQHQHYPKTRTFVAPRILPMVCTTTPITNKPTIPAVMDSSLCPFHTVRPQLFVLSANSTFFNNLMCKEIQSVRVSALCISFGRIE